MKCSLINKTFVISLFLNGGVESLKGKQVERRFLTHFFMVFLTFKMFVHRLKAQSISLL